MGRASRRDDVDGDYVSRRARQHRKDTSTVRAQPDQLPDSPPLSVNDEVHSSRRRTASRRHRHSISQSWQPNQSFAAAAAAASSTMPPPPAPAPAIGLTRSATDIAYRRPVNCLAPDVRYDVPLVRRHSARDEASPSYHRTRAAGDYSAHSSAASGLLYGDVYDLDDIEVVEEVDERPVARYRERRQPSRDVYIESSSDRRHHRRSRRPHLEDDGASRMYYATSEGGSAAHASPRTPDRSVLSRRERGYAAPDVIEDSRPPVSSRPAVHRRHRSAEIIQPDHSKVRRSSTIRSARVRAGSTSAGPSGIIGSIFGASTVRLDSPEKRVKEVKMPRRRVECVICMGDISESKACRLKCEHYMCRSCLERVFRLSTTDPQHMPPRCCTQDHIPLRHVDRLFDSDFKKTWNRKFAEFSTKNRIYCPSRKCGEWIKPANIRRENGTKVAKCSRCKTKVCCSCNGRWHGTGPCPNDQETAAILAQAQAEGWKRCFRCKNLVELKEGCNHMTCRCGAEFCMICGIKWKNCDCPWFNDDNRPMGFLDELAVPHIRGDLHGIFHDDGPPTPAELRGRPASPPMRMQNHQPPRGYHAEMRMRRGQELRDAEYARQLQHVDEYNDIPAHTMMGGLGDMHGIGNAAGHHMNDSFRRGVLYAPLPHNMAPRDMPQYGDNWRSRGRLEGSQERRLADRLSETRSGYGSPPAAGPIYPVGMNMAPPPVPPGPVPMVPRGIPPYGLEAEMYNMSIYTPRAERVTGSRTTRDYEDEAEAHSASWSSRHRNRPKSSELAGLVGTGQGMNRVSQWRTFVEPGVPDGESANGHV